MQELVRLDLDPFLLEHEPMAEGMLYGCAARGAKDERIEQLIDRRTRGHALRFDPDTLNDHRNARDEGIDRAAIRDEHAIFFPQRTTVRRADQVQRRHSFTR
ncbi:MAG: hypothetical protein M3Q88_04520 [Pseudomonadota bacterium]|nr:hypothetical protein [Pseudomonadota bacterium]